jgi:hypothetical protein
MMTLSAARRALVAGSVALAIGVPMLACSGMPTTTTDVATEEPETPAAGNKLVGTWKMMPTEERLRELKIIDAAISGKAQKRERLEPLSAEEESLFKEWEGKKGDEVKTIKSEMRFMRNSQFDFTDTEVTVHFGEDEKFGPVVYEVVSTTDTNTTIKFDPGLGNGVETHSFTWESDTKGVDNITAADGTTFEPMNVAKKQ